MALEELPLNKWMNDFGLDRKVFANMRKRLMIVGRFSQADRGGPPQRFLFTNRKGLDEKYQDLFKDHGGKRQVHPLDYKSFVTSLAPSLVLCEEWEPGSHERQIPRIVMRLPRYNQGRDQMLAPVDLYHYLFQRAASSTEIDQLKKLEPSLNLLLSGENAQPGKAMFLLIRSSLHDFGVFQPQVYKIIDAFARLLRVCAAEAGLPAHAHGNALPGGFPERLISFLFAENYTAEFDFDGLSLNRNPWTRLRDEPDNQKTRKSFKNIVEAFRDHLLFDGGRDQFGGVFFDLRTLDDQAEAIFSGRRDQLRVDFRKARDAFNLLHQILRDKGLIAMVLQWLLSEYSSLRGVAEKGAESDRDAYIAELVLNGSKDEGRQVAAPVIRASLAKREAFADSLAVEHEALIQALIIEDEPGFEEFLKKTKAFATTAPQGMGESVMATAARTLRADRDFVTRLRELATPIGDTDTKKALIKATQAALLIAVSPALFDLPILDYTTLRRIFKEETQRTYMLAILMIQRNQDKIGRLGYDFRELLREKIDPVTREIRDGVELRAALLKKYIKMIADKDFGDQLENGRRVLEAAGDILDHLSGAEGAGVISACAPESDLIAEQLGREVKPDELSPAESTEYRSAGAEVALKVMVTRAIDRRASKTAAAGVAAPGGGRDDTNAPVVNAPGQSAPRPDPAVPEGGAARNREAGDTYIQKKTEGVADAVLAKWRAGGATGGFEAIEPERRERLTEEAMGEILKDDAFMNRLRGDLESYQKILYLIYERYTACVDRADMDGFTDPVDRLTLTNMMTLFHKELRLGGESSNLHALLIDMVENIDRRSADTRKFIRNISLTRYFNDSQIAVDEDLAGFTTIKQTLDKQLKESLEETRAFVSELWGIRYLMEALKKQDVEVIVVNSNAEEFLDWVRDDNLPSTVTASHSGCLRSEKLASNPSEWMQPGLVYLSDSAFRSTRNDKLDFINTKLKTFDRNNSSFRMILPPICISTPFAGDVDWPKIGKALAGAAEDKQDQQLPAPVVIVGPSPFLNSREDYYRTWLPAGYVFATNFLRGSVGDIPSSNIPRASQGRFRVIGHSVPMAKTVQEGMWPQSSEDGYGFAIDYYLYVILTARLAAEGRAGVNMSAERILSFYNSFNWLAGGNSSWTASAKEITSYLCEGTGTCFSVEPRYVVPEDEPNRIAPWGIREVRAGRGEIKRRDSVTIPVQDVSWFNAIRKKMQFDEWVDNSD